MAIVVEDGTLITGANSYVSRDELRNYAAARGLDIPAVAPTAPVTVYSNCAGSGDRTSGDDLVTVASNITLSSGTVENIVDGDKANTASEGALLPTGVDENDYISFDFGEGNLKYIDAFKVWGAVTDIGAWVIEASNDNTNWVEQKASFTLNTDTLGYEHTFTPTSTLGFRCWRLRKDTGATSGTKWVTEVEFKIADEKIAQLITKAMDYIESLEFKGVKRIETQALQWPRADVAIDGYLIDLDEIPQLLKEGQMEAALAIDNGEDPLADIGRVTTKSSVGPISVEYAPGRATTIVRRLNSKLRKLIRGGSSGGTSFIVSRG